MVRCSVVSCGKGTVRSLGMVQYRKEWHQHFYLTRRNDMMRQVRDLHLLGISPDPFLHCMACIDLKMPPDHNMVLNEAVEVPSWMDTSFGQVKMRPLLKLLAHLFFHGGAWRGLQAIHLFWGKARAVLVAFTTIHAVEALRTHVTPCPTR